jgi:hypothetical protein
VELLEFRLQRGELALRLGEHRLHSLSNAHGNTSFWVYGLGFLAT